MSLPVCPECKGERFEVEHGVVDQATGEDFGSVIRPCPACGGSGVNPKAVEAVGRYMNPGPWWDDPEYYKASIALYREQAVDVIEVVAAVFDKEGTSVVSGEGET